MRLIETNFGQETITRDNLSYRLDGKIGPRLFNLGDGDVRVNGVLLKANNERGDGFVAGSPFTVSHGNLQIVFEDKKAKNKVVCFYETERKPRENCQR